MTVDLTDLLRDRLASMDARLARIESKLMEDDAISPQDLLGKLQAGFLRMEKMEGRMEGLESTQAKLIGALIFISAVVLPLVSLFAPMLRDWMHLE